MIVSCMAYNTLFLDMLNLGRSNNQANSLPGIDEANTM